MRLLDQHWLAGADFLAGRPGPWERFKLRLAPRLQLVPIGVVISPPDPARAAGLLAELGLREHGYVLFCAGGGGYSSQGRPAPEFFAEAAAKVTRETSLAVVWVRGPNYAGARVDLPGVTVIDSLDAPGMIGLMAGAHLAVLNGGSMLLQALALEVPAVAAPVAADQRRRIGDCSARGLTVAAALDADALAAATLALLRDPAAHAALRERLAALHLTNGVETAIAALQRLLV
jgi:glycosyltransferase involved in cell wall biosynthesis